MLAAALTAAVAVTFAMSAAAKLADPGAFRRSLPATLGVAPLRANRLAPAVVAAELAVLPPLVLGAWWVPAALLGFASAAALLIAFTAALLSMIRRGVTEPCHCFGAQDSPPGRLDLVRNGLLAGFAVAGLVVAAVAGPVVGSSAVEVGGGALLGAAAALLVVRLDDLRWMVGPVLPGLG
ncbi:MauE/DoxX family redox-associated membrane protein [Pseudonocardia humida]|uniref:Methylamine utilization protein MauE n=1 Tax=Pseudonocardia humida TaxID=2800819 RepID=A0ABT1A3V4_9PSEU|nr:MauE/DoxX family redox-associated membrane protein [Pseudonocardia humida]MCO1657660.1 methylamine utilization protein MauE [Pseudonocardia humida]